MERNGWDVIISGTSGSRNLSITRKKLRLLIAGAVGVGIVFLAGVGLGIWGAVIIGQNYNLKKENAELQRKVAMVSEMERELADMRETTQRLKYILGLDTLTLPETEPLSPGTVSPAAGSRSENTVPQGLPVSGPITQKFSEKHPGIDIAAPKGTPVVATAMGRVERAGQDKTLGLVVEIGHPSGFKTIYGHLSKILVKDGQSVYGGDIIGNVGETGNVTGPHLHYGITKDGSPVDPTGNYQ
ncbi:MAG: peptidoglycan DD-metalloendopeptidase family protein [candidate division WOR-3 bacterium]